MSLKELRIIASSSIIAVVNCISSMTIASKLGQSIPSFNSRSAIHNAVSTTVDEETKRLVTGQLKFDEFTLRAR